MCGAHRAWIVSPWLVVAIVQVLVDAQYPGKVRILTKSPIVTRDVDLLTRLPKVDVE